MKYPVLFKHSLLILLAMAALLSNLRAQAPPEGFDIVNPTRIDDNILSPNAAIFQRFGNIPVNLYTGTPNITVPIHQVKVGTRSLPLSISYHASGIKNNDLSGDVGLGWELSAEYTISRVIHGKPDEHGYVGSNDSSDIPASNTSSTSPATYSVFKASAKGLIDAQPDEFMFNIGSASGKFILSPNSCKIIPDQDVKVEYEYVTGGMHFVLTDAKGVKYFFNDVSTSSAQGCGDDPGTLDYFSSWHVSRIIYPDTKDSLVFHYTTHSLALNQHSESITYNYGATINWQPQYKNCESYSYVTEKKLSEIIAPEETVLFTYSFPKKEITDSALSFIEVETPQGTDLKKINFAYSYYNASSNNQAKRLRLDSVYTTAATLEVGTRYKFGYNSEQPPAYQSKAQDIWGYFNGSNNSSLIPGNTYKFADLSGMYFYVPGGNRIVDTGHCKAGVLTSITYPTGGSTSFQYESNTYGFGVYDTVFINNTLLVNSSCNASTSNPLIQSNQTDFSVNYTQQAQLTIGGNNFNCTGDTRKIVLKDLTTNQVIVESDDIVEGFSDLLLEANHTYRLLAETNCENAEQNMLNCTESINASLAYKTATSEIRKYRTVGGLRVKAITDYDPYANTTNTRKYLYHHAGDEDRSSGILLFTPVFDYTSHLIFDKNWPPQGDGFYIPDPVSLASFIYTSQANNANESGGSIVGYQYVTEVMGENGTGGKNVYAYNTYAPSIAGARVAFPFTPNTSYSHRNGLLLESKSFDAGNTLRRQTNNFYSFASNGSVNGWKAAYSKYYLNPAQVNPDDFEEFIGESYLYPSEKIRIDSTVTNDFPSTSLQNAVTTRLIFQYSTSSNYYPYKEITHTSDGKVLNAFTYRAADFTVTPNTGLTGMSEALKHMNSQHLNDYVVEKYLAVDGKVFKGSIVEYERNAFGTVYKIGVSKYYLLNTANPLTNYTPVNRQVTVASATLTKDSRYLPEAAYSNYNDKGNAGTYIVNENKQIIALWGYSGRYLVAKIENINPAGFYTWWNGQSALQSTLNSPASDAALMTAIQSVRSQFPNAMVTGFAYKPGVGTTCVSDADNTQQFYSYDAFNRLMYIKDANGKILKSYTYKFQGPQ